MKYTPPPGMKRIRDWYGRRVQTTRTLVNGAIRVPAGSIARVRSWSTVGFNIEADACKCCGVSVFMTRLCNADFIDASNDVPPEGRIP